MKLSEYVSDFSKVNVLVIGDLMLDKYIWGSVDRISPEAPVQVVNVKKESYAPGGASNVAHNLAALSGNVFLVGLVGKDDTNGKLLSMLKEKKINTEGVIYDENKPTTQKMRIIAHNQQLLRVDYEDKEYINEDDEKLIIEYVEKMIDKIDVIVVSDYAKGLITKSLVEKLVSVAKDKKIIVDPKPKHFEYYKGASLITPNHKEACEMLSLDVKNSGLEDVGKKISEKMESSVLITRGEEGMMLFDKGKEINIPTKAKEVYDVTGAGDTVIAALALSIGAGSDNEQAAIIANHAAGITVGKVGTSVVSVDELKRSLDE